LALVFRELPADEASRLAADLGASNTSEKRSGESPSPQTEQRFSLWEAVRGDERVGAVFARFQSGSVAWLWPPRLVADEPESTAHALLERLLADLESLSASMAQVVLPLAPEQNTPELQASMLRDTTRLQSVGFEHCANLDFLICFESHFPNQKPATAMDFLPWSRELDARLRSVIERSYQGTLDCPTLNGRSDLDEVIREYRATGVFDPARWLLVRHSDEDVGCLLLTHHPETAQWELMYMGLVPTARGHGRGWQMVRHAQWLAHEAGIARMVLAVDRANAPAQAMYASAGFTAWASRSVWLKFFR
jgi:GNAT superfamily N-acetyltransferase